MYFEQVKSTNSWNWTIHST